MEPLGSLHTSLDVAYAVFAGVLALAFWAALALLVVTSRQSNHWLRQFGLMLITLVAAVFWTTSMVMRLTGATDANLLNQWSRVLYAMLATYVLGYAWLNWKVNRGGD